MVKKQSSAFSLILLLTSATPQFLSGSLASASSLLAAAPGTNVRINGSGSMTAVNQALKQRFEKQFPDTQVSLESGGTAVGLQSVLDDKADLAAIARPLTPAETAKGLVAVPVGREKIAIVIGSNNKLSKGLNSDQFAKIFRGEIKNWSQVGGSAGAIRLVDRPVTNDTRQAFRNYPVFQSGKFESGATAKKSDDSPRSVIQALGRNGISYLPLSQVRNQSGVKAVLMDGASPTDVRYPFSQPLFYVYKGATPNPAAAAFLSYATASSGQQAVKQTGAVAVKGADPTKTTNVAKGTAAPKKAAKGAKATSLNAASQKADNLTNNQVAQVPAADDGGLLGDLGLPAWLLWLFPLGSLAALIWMLGKSRDSQRPQSISAYRDPNPDFPGGFDPLQTVTERAGGATLAGAAWEPDRNGEVTDHSDWLFENPNLDSPTSETHAEGSFLADDRDLTEPETDDDTTWGLPAAGFGVANAGGALAGGAGAAAWSFLSGNRRRSDSPSEIVPTPAVESVVTGEAISSSDPQGVASSYLQGVAPSGEVASRLVLSSRNAHWAYAHWDIPRSLKVDVQRQGGENLVLRLYDVTGLSGDAPLPEQYEQFDCDDFALSCDVPIAASDRTYVAEIGYLSPDHQWSSLARSTPTWISAHERMG